MMGRLIQKTIVFLVYVFLYAPILMLILMSFNTSRYSSFPAPGWSLKWYVEALNDEAIIDATITSTIIAVIVAVIATTLGTLASIALVRFRVRGKFAFQSLFMAPLPIPEVVIAIALLVFASKLNIGSGVLPLIAGHVLMGIPFVVTIVSARLYGVDASLDEAAMDLGANAKQVMRLIIIPLAAPGIIGGFILSFTISFDNFLARQFETSANADIHEMTTAREIIADFEGDRLDYFVAGYGTGGTITGVARVLRKQRPDTKIILSYTAHRYPAACRG